MLHSLIRPALATGFALTVVAASAPASATFIAGEIGSPATTVTFNEVVLANNVAIGTAFQSYGVTFSGVYYDGQSSPSLPGDLIAGFSGHSATNFILPQGSFPMVQQNPFSILFDTAVSEFSFRTSSNGQLTRFEALLNGAVVETVDQGTTGAFNGQSEAYGFTGIVFDEIRVTSSVFGAQSFRFDTLKFSAATTTSVAEPGAAGLLGLGLAGLALAARRWRRH